MDLFTWMPLAWVSKHSQWITTGLHQAKSFAFGQLSPIEANVMSCRLQCRPDELFLAPPPSPIQVDDKAFCHEFWFQTPTRICWPVQYCTCTWSVYAHILPLLSCNDPDRNHQGAGHWICRSLECSTIGAFTCHTFSIFTTSRYLRADGAVQLSIFLRFRKRFFLSLQ